MPQFWRDPSGGWLYHLRAWRAREGWSDFRQKLSPFLSPWIQEQQRSGRRIVLVGASGGYTLPWSVLAPVANKIIVEPDPMARWILRQRDPHIRIDPRPALGWGPKSYCSRRLGHWLEEYRDDALLFCNLLGQLDEKQTLAVPKWRSTLLSGLQSRPWLSYHDLISSTRRPAVDVLNRPHQDPRTQRPSPILDEALWRQIFPDASRPVEIVDHGTARFFANSALPLKGQRYFAWPLNATRWHLIEGLASATPSRGCAKSKVTCR